MRKLKTLDQFITEDYNQFSDFLVLNEGGAYGHLSHPFEDINLTLQDLRDMIDTTIEGAFGPENFVWEKTDGQQISISWKDGRLIAARNKKHIKNAGENALTLDGIAELFKGRGDIEIAYNAAMLDLTSAIGSLSEADKLEFFENGKKMMSLEVMTPITQNTVPYGQSMLVFHGVVEYDVDGNVIGEDKGAAVKLGKLISDANLAAQSTFFIRGPQELEIKAFPNTAKRKGYYNKLLKTIMKDTDTSLNSTVGEYAIGMGVRVLKDQMKGDNIEIAEEFLPDLAKRIAGINKSYKAGAIKKDLGEAGIWYLDLEKKKAKVLKRLVYSPLENLFIEIGTEMMKNMSAFLSANPTSSTVEMRKEIDATIVKIRKVGNEEQINKLEHELQRVAAAGGMDSIVPTEGITFVFKGKVYKYTGIFSPIHQIRTMLGFGN
jgi:hypothetical protein